MLSQVIGYPMNGTPVIEYTNHPSSTLFCLYENISIVLISVPNHLPDPGPGEPLRCESSDSQLNK